MDSVTSTYIGIVCPMANEGPAAVDFARAVLAQFTLAYPVTLFVIFDKANRDDSLERMRDYGASEPRLRIVWAPENRNVVDAYVRGYREAVEAKCDWILEIDAGFSHQPEEIPRFLELLHKGYDCIFGCRFMPGGKMEDPSYQRYLISRSGSALTNLLIGTELRDMTSGFEMFSRSTMEMLLRRGIQSKAHFFQTEIKVYCQYLKAAEVPITYRSPSPRLGSKALEDAFNQLWRLTKLRWKGDLARSARMEQNTVVENKKAARVSTSGS